MSVRRPAPARIGSSLVAFCAVVAVQALCSPEAAAQLQFRDATPGQMPADGDLTYSAAFGDVDGDGDLDLVLGKFGHQNRLYLNDGAGTFRDATAGRMPVDSDFSGSVAFGDVDGDGDLDLGLANSSPAQQNRLYLNDGMGHFSDVTAIRMPADSDGTGSVAFGDVDGDGDLDLVLGIYGQDRLYINDGAGTFSDATASRMPVIDRTTSAVAVGDVDGDGDLDLAVGNWGQQNGLYLNDGTGRFSDATASRMPVDGDETDSVAFGDADGDGDLDLVIGNTGGRDRNRLYLNDGTGTFSDVTASRMPVNGDISRSVVFGDMDGDGDLDLVLGDGRSGQRVRLYLNDGTGTFSDVSATRMPAVTDGVLTVAIGDVDGDGDLDLVLGTDRQSRLYQNLHRQLDTQASPTPGLPFHIDAYSRRYGASGSADQAFLVMSTGTGSTPIPGIGILGLDPNVLVPLPGSPLAVPQPQGVGSLSLLIPNLPGLVGSTIYLQALMQGPGQHLRLTSVVADTIR